MWIDTQPPPFVARQAPESLGGMIIGEAEEQRNRSPNTLRRQRRGQAAEIACETHAGERHRRGPAGLFSDEGPPHQSRAW